MEIYEFTAQQVEVLEEVRRQLHFTPQEIEERHSRTQAALAWIAAADTLEEQQHRGDRVWAEQVERPRAAGAHPGGTAASTGRGDRPPHAGMPGRRSPRAPRQLIVQVVRPGPRQRRPRANRRSLGAQPR